MRYVNLKKRNTSKLNYVTKKVATLSLLSLAFLSVIVVPLTMNRNQQNGMQYRIAIVENEDLGNDNIETLDLDDLKETDM